MRWRFLSALVVTVLAQPGWTQSEQSPIVRVELDPTEVNVGQALQLRVTVLVPSWFTKPPVYPNFELANAVTRLPDDSSFPTSERVGNDTWSGIVRDYQVYPQLAARYIMAEQRMRISYMNLDGMRPTKVEVPVPEVAFQASVPAGAESLEPFLGGSRVTLDRDIRGDLQSLKAGDAIVVTVTATIEGMPAMFLPRLVPESAQPGLLAYAREPSVEDGEMSTRSEAVTYLFQAGGEFTLPAMELGWWNTDTQQLELASVAAVTISVVGAPAVTEEPAAEAGIEALGFRGLAVALAVAVAVLVVAFLLLRGFRLVRSAWRRRREVWLASEGYAFRNLTRSVAACDGRETDRWLGLWLERLDGGVSREIVSRRSGVANLSRCIRGITRRQYAADSVEGDEASASHAYSQLGRELRQARSGYLRWQGARDVRRSLPPLNPPMP